MSEGTLYLSWKRVQEAAVQIVAKRLLPPTIVELVNCRVWNRRDWPPELDARLCHRDLMAAFVLALINTMDSRFGLRPSQVDDEARSVLQEEKENIRWRSRDVLNMNHELCQHEVPGFAIAPSIPAAPAATFCYCGALAIPGEERCYAHQSK